MKIQIELHDDHYVLLAAQAAEHYREPKQHAAWVVACAVSASAVVQRAASDDTDPDIHQPCVQCPDLCETMTGDA